MTFAVDICADITALPSAAWDACAGRADPFVSHGFLAALETSGSACAATGWQPQHLCVRASSGDLVAVAPLYLKSHSYGEYVFDWGWAEAYQRAGGRYYPKLQACVPFTPATGRRLLVRPGEDPIALGRVLVTAMLELARTRGASSLHVTFPTRQEWELCGDMGLSRRVGVQFHWHNRGYRSFDDFLAALVQRKRKAIKKERREVAESGVAVRTLSGAAIEERHWRAFHRFYLDTIDRKWAQAYLTLAFFLELPRALGERVVLVVAEDGGEPVAAALHLLGDDALFGRYWGSTGEHRFLHFEACYYRAIDLAIERGLARVEAGAQGPHKIQRGYLPAETWSAHWLADRRLGQAVGSFLERERRAVAAEVAALGELSPYRRGGE
ncbi:MAG: N-acetyltransferase [Myxococcales bacterium]|nr:N-acetyltransferase [Myxococcales bacterium]